MGFYLLMTAFKFGQHIYVCQERMLKRRRLVSSLRSVHRPVVQPVGAYWAQEAKDASPFLLRPVTQGGSSRSAGRGDHPGLPLPLLTPSKSSTCRLDCEPARFEADHGHDCIGSVFLRPTVRMSQQLL